MGKLILLAGVFVLAQILNAMPSARPVSHVASSVVAEIRQALNSNKTDLVLQLLRDNGLGINSQLTAKRETLLHLVAVQGNLQLAEQLISQGVRVNVRDNKGNTPLAYAQDNDHAQLAELLQIHTETELALFQDTSKPQDLWQAAANNDLAGTELLLAEGANPNEQRHHGRSTYDQLGFKTPFHIAFEAEHYSLAAFLLKEAQGINGLDERGWTPLMLAIVADNWDMVRELIKDGADIFAGYHRGSVIQNALDVAKVMESEAQLVDAFVEEKGASGVVHTNGETVPLIELSLAKGYLRVVKLLLEHGAEKPTIRKSLSQPSFWSPLAIAAMDNDWELVQKLIRDGADIFSTSHHQNALNVEMVLRLINISAKLKDAFFDKWPIDTPIDIYGNTLFTLVARQGDLRVVRELLLEHGADINHGNNAGYTALHWAAYEGHVDVVKLLLKHGADINRGNHNGTAALSLAAYSGQTDVVKLLLKHGADINFQDSYGRTALMNAVSSGWGETANLLLEHGADINLRDNHGETVVGRVKHYDENWKGLKKFHDAAEIIRTWAQQLALP